MNFNDVFLMVGISVISGIIGGLVVVWSFKGVHFGGKGIHFYNKDILERYIWKYSFLLAILIFCIFIISLIFFLLDKIDNKVFTIVLFSLTIISLILIYLTIKLKWE